MSTKNPIRPSMYIKSKINEVNWVDFRYEKLPLFCFYYGYMSHSKDYCKKDEALSHGIT